MTGIDAESWEDGLHARAERLRRERDQARDLAEAMRRTADDAWAEVERLHAQPVLPDTSGWKVMRGHDGRIVTQYGGDAGEVWPHGFTSGVGARGEADRNWARDYAVAAFLDGETADTSRDDEDPDYDTVLELLQAGVHGEIDPHLPQQIVDALRARTSQETS